MALDPAGIISILEKVATKEETDAALKLVYNQLPTCIQRAIATLQCAQLEKDYKPLAAKWKADFNIDLPSWMREKTHAIIQRQR